MSKILLWKDFVKFFVCTYENLLRVLFYEVFKISDNTFPTQENDSELSNHFHLKGWFNYQDRRKLREQTRILASS